MEICDDGEFVEIAETNQQLKTDMLLFEVLPKNTFDIRDGDVSCYVTDCGWIIRQSYIVYISPYM